MFVLIQLFIAAGVLLLLYLLSKDRGSKEPRSMLWAALGFGLLAIPIAMFFESFIGIRDFLDVEGMPMGWLAQQALWIGLIEECAKFLPLAIFIYKKGYFNEHTDGVLYFAVAGLGFGVPENILYTVQEGTATGVGRLILTPIFHAATTAFIGYYLARAKVERRSLRGPALALVAMILVHAFYDFGLLSQEALLVFGSVLTTASISGALFLYASTAKKQDEFWGLSAIGTNKFCRKCGRANPHLYLYCARCGKRA